MQLCERGPLSTDHRVAQAAGARMTVRRCCGATQFVVEAAKPPALRHHLAEAVNHCSVESLAPQ
jgi:hypothetical protein